MGRRPLGEQQPFNSYESKVKGDFDAKGRKVFDGYAPGQNFRKKTSAELVGEVRQAAQEAPEAVEQMRIPKATQGIIKGYFRNLGDQKPEPKP
jgi:hypothetical protein